MKVLSCSFGNVPNMQSFTFASPFGLGEQKQQPKMKRKQWDEERHAIEKLLSIAVWTHTHNFFINRIIHHHLHLNCLVLGTFFREENNKIRLFSRGIFNQWVLTFSDGNLITKLKIVYLNACLDHDTRPTKILNWM